MIVLEAADARVCVDPQWGARVASLRVRGQELLVTRDQAPDPVRFGCYPMAPWAGRVRHGRFAHAGRRHRLPLRLPPHALHGTVLDRPWEPQPDASLRIDLGPDWPFAGHAVQRFTLEDFALELVLEVHAEAEAFPATLGWHPWFRKRLAAGGPLALSFEADAIYLRDAEGIPDGRRAAPGAGPFDDCFTGLRRDPVLQWPGVLDLTLSSSCDHWVLYDEPEHATCVEPQSGPPDAFTLCPELVMPGRPLVGRFRMAWSDPGGEAPASG